MLITVFKSIKEAGGGVENFKKEGEVIPSVHHLEANHRLYSKGSDIKMNHLNGTDGNMSKKNRPPPSLPLQPLFNTDTAYFPEGDLRTELEAEEKATSQASLPGSDQFCNSPPPAHILVT